MTDEPSPFHKILAHYAQRLGDAPGAARLARLAKSAECTPEPQLHNLAALIIQLDGVHLAGDDIARHLIDIAYADAMPPAAASTARAEFKERVAWWRTALSRAAELCRCTAAHPTRVSSELEVQARAIKLTSAGSHHHSQLLRFRPQR